MSRNLQSGPGWRWHSTTFRLLMVYAVLFAISVMVLLGVIASAITRDMEHETDVVIDWQMIYFDAMPDSELQAAILRRLEHERMHTSYYGLFSATGKHIAGDVLAFPPELGTSRKGVTLDHTLETTDGQVAPVVRAMAEQRANGDKLVLARDLTHILRIREAIVNALIVGGVLCLVAGVASGLALTVRQIRRMTAVRQVTQRIARGDLGQRLPIGGRDEIDMLSHLVNHMLEEIERLMYEVKGVCDGIAHDLRTPLAHVHAILTRVAQRAESVDDDPLSHLIEQARAETNGLLARFHAMLRISEIGTLRRRGGFTTLQLDELVIEIGQLFEPLADSRSIQLFVRTGVVTPVYGDRELLFEALTNLVDNALKYTPVDGVVCIELCQTMNGPRITVSDNGPGIPLEERDTVLRAWYRSKRTGHVAGSGLGLSIVSAVIRVHDFGLRISDAAPGTCVIIDCWSQTLG
ncbi:histidine kinase [Burkholderia ubonensis]|nr:histidine kinase [Burkholderia ubonensis]